MIEREKKELYSSSVRLTKKLPMSIYKYTLKESNSLSPMRLVYCIISREQKKRRRRIEYQVETKADHSDEVGGCSLL